MQQRQIMSYLKPSLQEIEEMGNETFEQQNNSLTVSDAEAVVSGYALIALKLWRTVPIILLAVGTVGNLVTIAVLLRKNLRASSSHLYLLALTVTDLLILYLGLFRRWLYYSFDVDIRLELGCGPHIWLLYACLGCSSWILVALTLERVISVKFPVYARNGFSRKVTSTVLISIVTVSAVFDLIYLFAYKRSDKHLNYQPSGNITSKIVCVQETQLSHIIEVWFWLDLAFASLVPFAILFIGNMYIAHELIVHRIQKQQTDTSHHHHRPITKLLIFLSLMFAITTLPARLTVCVVPQTSYLWKQGEFKLWWAISNLAMYT